VQATCQLADVAIAQRCEAVRGFGNKILAGIVDHDRHILARQPHLGFERNPLGRHVGGKQRMAGGKRRLVPEIKQRDFLAQKERGADLRWADSGRDH
jgi:hypothetical protein